jgi:hypothetical protein
MLRVPRAPLSHQHPDGALPGAGMLCKHRTHDSARSIEPQETCESTVPAISYPVTFAVSNVLPTIRVLLHGPPRLTSKLLASVRRQRPRTVACSALAAWLDGLARRAPVTGIRGGPSAAGIKGHRPPLACSALLHDGFDALASNRARHGPALSRLHEPPTTGSKLDCRTPTLSAKEHACPDRQCPSSYPCDSPSRVRRNDTRTLGAQGGRPREGGLQLGVGHAPAKPPPSRADTPSNSDWTKPPRSPPVTEAAQLPLPAWELPLFPCDTTSPRARRGARRCPGACRRDARPPLAAAAVEYVGIVAAAFRSTRTRRSTARGHSHRCHATRVMSALMTSTSMSIKDRRPADRGSTRIAIASATESMRCTDPVRATHS